jgi:chemotaxis signal transduction protein
MSSKTQSSEGLVAEYVTAVIGGQLFGLPISRVQDVFMPERLTRVPLSSSEIAGVLNLRGRIVTVVDMRARLGLPKAEDGKPPMAVGVDLRGESYGLRSTRSARCCGCPTRAARKIPSISTRAWPSSPAASTASMASSWSSSTSIASSNWRPRPRLPPSSSARRNVTPGEASYENMSGRR